jgi:HlyD family secretion protein
MGNDEAGEHRGLGDVALVPGMPVEVFVRTGDRNVLSYLVKPLTDQVTRAYPEQKLEPISGAG